MPAQQQWTWTEVFSHLQVDPQKIHSDWKTACHEIDCFVDNQLPTQQLQQLDARFAPISKTKPQELIYRGLGWGALENYRASAQGKNGGIPEELPFTENDLGPQQQPWIELLDKGSLPVRKPDQDPGQYMIQEQWRQLLEDSIETGKGEHWLSWLHLGIMCFEAGDPSSAREAWEKSISLTPSLWAYRNLACLELHDKKPEVALKLLMQAWQLGPRITPVALEILHAMNELQAWPQLKKFLASLQEDIANHERVLLERARQALREDNLDELEGLLDREYDTIREGENMLTDLWFALHEKRLAKAEGIPIDDELKARVRREFPPPARIDFRMYT